MAPQIAGETCGKRHSNTMVFALLAVRIVAASIKLGTLMALTLVKDGRRHAVTEQLHKTRNKICKYSRREHHRSGTRDNNFDTMRLVAALCVVISHSFPLSYGGGAAVQPLYLLSNGQTTLGTVSVYIFFVLSGFLITG